MVVMVRLWAFCLIRIARAAMGDGDCVVEIGTLTGSKIGLVRGWRFILLSSLAAAAVAIIIVAHARICRQLDPSISVVKLKTNVHP